MFSVKNCWNAFFADHHRTTASDSSNININERRTGKQNCKLLKMAVQVKEQVSEAVVRRLQIWCSWKLCKFHKKTSLLESLFNKVVSLNVCNSIKKKLQHSCFSVKFANFLRTPFLQFQELLQWLLLRFNQCFQRSQRQI